MTDEYRASGVDYDLLDAAKRDAIAAAAGTWVLPGPMGVEMLGASRGQPAVVWSLQGRHFAMVLECLGTKSALAREYQELTGKDMFDAVGYDTVAAVVNDMCSVGALPMVVNAYFATGTPAWYSREGRFASLVRGWRAACEASGAAWGGGESPMLKGIVAEGEIDLAGCAVGAVPSEQAPLLGGALEPGDEIVMVASSGLHANGASLVRRAADALGGLGTPMPDGRSMGEALLSPSLVYVGLLKEIYARGLVPTYASHITGHGLRKVMRADRDLTYRLHSLLEVPVSLQFVVDALSLPARDAYGTFNMGNGFAVFCRPGDGPGVVEAAGAAGYVAGLCGAVEAGPRQVVLEAQDLVFSDEDLQLS
jgi:phosphoribosylformylglycinamidine cyclo-ligase